MFSSPCYLHVCLSAEKPGGAGRSSPHLAALLRVEQDSGESAVPARRREFRPLRLQLPFARGRRRTSSHLRKAREQAPPGSGKPRASSCPRSTHPSPSPPNPHRFLRTPVAGAASPGWGKSGRCWVHPAEERLMALGTGCEAGVRGTLQVASCRKGTAWLRWEEGGVPLWGQWGEQGTPGGGDTPGLAGKASHWRSRRHGQPCRGQRAAGTERLAVPGDRAVWEGGSAGIPSGSRRWEARSASHGAEPPCPGAAPRALGKRPRRSAEHRLPPQPAARTRSFPAGDGTGGRRSPWGTGRRSSPSPTQTARLPGCEQLIPKRCWPAKLRRSGRPRPLSLPFLRSRAHRGPRRAPHSAPLGSARKSPPSLSAPASHDLPQPAPPFVLIFGNEILPLAVSFPSSSRLRVGDAQDRTPAFVISSHLHLHSDLCPSK